jgi:superoxide oxidase
MTKDLKSAESVVATQVDDRFDGTSIMLHWLTVVLIVVQFASVWAIDAAGDKSPLGATLFSLHLSSGMLTWIVVVARLARRHYFAHLPPFPPSMPKIQQTVAKANEYGLYLFLLMQPVTGLARVLLRGQPVELFFWRVPALMEPDPAMRSLFVEAHEIGAKALMVLIGLHVGAALFHHLILRDGVLLRMLPRISTRAKLAPVFVRNDPE